MRRQTILCPNPGEFSSAVHSPVSFSISVSVPTFEQSQLDLFHTLWKEIHTKENPTHKWFADWCSRVPNFSGCGCGDFLKDYCIANPVRYDDFPAWSWELHNAVNAKVDPPKPQMSWAGFLSRYPRQQSPITELIAVTSLAPHRLERQSVVLENWKNFGLKIVSVNTHEEFKRIEKDYPQVSAWVHSESDCKTQRINSLLDVSTRWDVPILLINSDVEIYGDQSRLLNLVRDNKSAIGIRHNYGVNPGRASQERWGLDAYLLYPEVVERLPRVDWAIGKPMWDYWLAWELGRMDGNPIEWIGEPYFFHKSHAVAWTQAECVTSHNQFNSRFGNMDWNLWRRAQPFWVPEE